jgi:hypothetical protein
VETQVCEGRKSSRCCGSAIKQNAKNFAIVKKKNDNLFQEGGKQHAEAKKKNQKTKQTPQK